MKLDKANSRISLPRLGWIRYRNSREVIGEVKNVTVSQSCGKWYVSTLCKNISAQLMRLGLPLCKQAPRHDLPPDKDTVLPQRLRIFSIFISMLR
ncbi:hypothetical protein SY86_22890 [Erwinia tracheiphila]|uniref:Transposase n=1 Tax=Erwinia tracheiphila TaxID=65700 RepID=A0A0M2KDY8_9GAMM|nr:hypothetical protein SY86_22890 [Erwinia tracheiphila]